jgi:hypothetical protein
MLYQFTADERAWIEEAQAEVVRRMATIAQIHRITGNLVPTPDMSGFIEAPKQ